MIELFQTISFDSPEEKQCALGIVAELLALRIDNPDTGDLELSYDTRKKYSLQCFGPANLIYGTIRERRLVSEEYNELQKQLAVLTAEEQQTEAEKQKAEEEFRKLASEIHKGCLVVNDQAMKQKCYGMVKEAIESYDNKKGNPPQEGLELRQKVQARKP